MRGFILFKKNIMSKTMLTQEGHTNLKTELESLIQKRDQLIARIEEVAQPDESGEDGLATQLKEELELIIAKIDTIEETLANSKIINGEGRNGTVQVGSKVTIKLASSNVREFHIVSEIEADPTVNKISDQSPIGQALLGKKVNDEIEVEAPVGKMTYKIVSIQ